MMLLGGLIMSYLALALLWWVLQVVANWRIFTKAGEAGWKSIIPIYSDYITYKIAWKNRFMFWIWLIGMFLLWIGAGSLDGGDPTATSSILGTLGALAAFVSYVLMNVKKSAAFGHGIPFAIGMLLFPPIFTLILGFGSSVYYGPQD